MDLIAPRLYGIGTHHKTGTLWMRAVFRTLAERTGVAHRTVFPGTGADGLPETERAYLFQWSSAFPEALLARPDIRVLHLIRDPRDVLLSGMRYHLTAGVAEEPFLHVPRADLGGATYREHLAALPDDSARLLFEMGEKHAETVAAMTAWTPRRNTIEVRYEDLMADTEGRAFREHLRNLGLLEAEVAIGGEIFLEHALFGGMADPARRRPRVAAHVTDGGPGRWRRELPLAVARDYARRFGPALVALGYETHPSDWVEELRDAA